MSEEGGEISTISNMVQDIQKVLSTHSDAPHLDAQRIILHVLDKREPSYLLAHSEDILSETQVTIIQKMADKRQTGMPLAYILGEADFYGRTFIVTPDVLIPRPDTEELIEKALEYIQSRHSGLRAGIYPPKRRAGVDAGSRSGMTEKQNIIIADICTGSGIIAITLALELEKLSANKADPPYWRATYRLIATDISAKALAIAKKNAEQHGVLDRIEFLQGDMLKPLEDIHIDLIVSNPPYIPSAELDENESRHAELAASREALGRSWNPTSTSKAMRGPRVKPGVTTRGLLFEPRIALDGGIDGQDFVKQIQQSNIPAIIETTGGEIIQLT